MGMILWGKLLHPLEDTPFSQWGCVNREMAVWSLHLVWGKSHYKRLGCYFKFLGRVNCLLCLQSHLISAAEPITNRHTNRLTSTN
jgi:hypothetical protein